MTATHLRPDANGEIVAPDAPGLGIEISASGVMKYLQDVDIRVKRPSAFLDAEHTECNRSTRPITDASLCSWLPKQIMRCSVR